MKKIRYRAVFNRKKQLRADGKGLVQIEAYLERCRMYVSTHIYGSSDISHSSMFSA